MEESSLFHGPMARKKPVRGHYAPNSYRVISEDAEAIPVGRPELHEADSTYTNIFGQAGERGLPETRTRRNRPNPRGVAFLRHDVRLLNAPVCSVSTDGAEQTRWWPHRTSLEPLKQPPFTRNTTVRADYADHWSSSPPRGSGRFTAHQPPAARGIVPVSGVAEADGSTRYWKEGISYEHQFDSRKDPHYPPRARRHGAFVWSRAHYDEVKA